MLFSLFCLYIYIYSRTLYSCVTALVVNQLCVQFEFEAPQGHFLQHLLPQHFTQPHFLLLPQPTLTYTLHPPDPQPPFINLFYMHANHFV